MRKANEEKLGLFRTGAKQGHETLSPGFGSTNR